MNKDSIIVEIKNGPYFGPEKDGLGLRQDRIFKLNPI